MKRLVRVALVLGCTLVAGKWCQATTYYVDYTNGSDSNNGTSQTTPWQHAPGMNGCTNTCSSTTINPGDSVILKGCVTWPNAALPWAWPYSGSSSAQIYVGVDQTWWDNTVSGCSTAWNRPILNGQAQSVNRGNGREDMIDIYQQYVTFDNFEITGQLANPAPSLSNNATDGIDLLGGSGSTGSQGVIINHIYMHGWVDPYWCYGTGNIAGGSATITNFTPSSACANTAADGPFGPSWVTNGYLRAQVYPQGSYWGVQSGNPTVQSITATGSTFTVVTNSAPNSSPCNACPIIIGEGNLNLISGNEGGNNGAIVENSVFDGSDTFPVSINPYADCGLSEGVNTICIVSGTVGWRGPQIWLNNVIRFVMSGYVGADGYFGGNLYENLGGRATIDPTAHTNIVEAVGSDAGLHWLFWNNVVLHTTNPNPNTPGGQQTVGLSIEPYASTGLASYTFNNVISDTISNNMFEPISASGYGYAYLFNNTMDCGPQWSLSYACASGVAQGGLAENNLFITTSSTVLQSGWTSTNNVTWTPTQATSAGYTPTQTPYIYSPTTSNCSGVTPCTVGEGTSIASLCSAISAIYAPAGAACLSDTPYGATYNTTNHTATVGPRSTITRPSTPDAGAYQYSASTGSAPTAPPSGLVATVNTN